MSGALGKKSSTIRNSNKSKDKFIKGDIVQYNPSTRELHYVSEGKHKTVKLEKDEAMRYLKYFRRCTKGLALDYLVQHHFRTNEGTYQVLQLSTRMSSPEETQKIVRDCETKFKKLIELADSKVKSKIVAVHNVVKSMLETKNRVSIVRDMFFPELVDQHGLKTILDNKDITEFKDRSVDHDKYTTYIDSDYEKNGLIKVMKREGAEKTYTYFAAKVCESIYDNAKALEVGKKPVDKIRNSILVIYMALNSTITQKSICGSLYFPIKENDYFLVNLTKAYGISSDNVRLFVQENALPDNLSFKFFTESHEVPLEFEWFTPWNHEDMEKEAQREWKFKDITECKRAWYFIYSIQGKGKMDTCNRLGAYKAMIQWRIHHDSVSDETIEENIKVALQNTSDYDNVMRYNGLLYFFLFLSLKYNYTFNLDKVPSTINIFAYKDINSDSDNPGILNKVYENRNNAKNKYDEYGELVKMLTNTNINNNVLHKYAFEVGKVGNKVMIYNGKEFNDKGYFAWAQNRLREYMREQRDLADKHEEIAYNAAQQEIDDVKEAVRILKDTKYTKPPYENPEAERLKDLNDVLKKYNKNEEFTSKEAVEAWIKQWKDDHKKIPNQLDTMEQQPTKQQTNQLRPAKPQTTDTDDRSFIRKAWDAITGSSNETQEQQPQEQQPQEQQPPVPANVGDTTTSTEQPKEEKHIESEGLSLRKLKKMGLKPWQIKQIRKEVKKIPKAGISELETLNEIKDMIETLLKKDKVEPPVDKAKLPIEPPEQTAQLQAQTQAAENIASVPMMLGDELNARRRALRHVEQTHYVPEVDKNTVKYDIENRNYTLKHVDPVKVAKTLQGLDKMLRKGTIAKNAPYVRLHPGTAAVIKMLATRANPNTYKGGVFRTIASLIPGGSAVYEVASRVYNAARPLIDKAVQKYDEAYDKHMHVKPKGNSPRGLGCNRPNGYMNAKQLKQYLIHNQKPKLSQLSQLLK